MFNLWLDYPPLEDEKKIVELTTGLDMAAVNKIINRDDIIFFQDLVRKVPVAENVIDYAVNLSSATRPKKDSKFDYVNNWIRWGAGPRASQFLVLAAKVKAVLSGKATPDISDIKNMALPVLRHRIVLSYHAEAENISVIEIIQKLINDLTDSE
jgi:MoxR-like ATPase